MTAANRGLLKALYKLNLLLTTALRNGYLPDGEPKAQRGREAYSQSHSWKWQNRKLNPGSLASESLLLTPLQ